MPPTGLVRDGTRPRPAKKIDPPPYKASIKILADKHTRSTANIDRSALDKIKKCLDRRNHPNTSEREAEAAWLLASRLMAQHNVQEAEVLAHESPEVQSKRGGHSIVAITRTDGSKTKCVRHYAWVSNLCNAMMTWFDCKIYSTAYVASVELTFYGIADNTVAAALAMEMAYNLAAGWSREYKGIASKNSYLLGVSHGMYDRACESKVVEEKQAKKAERVAFEARLEQEAAERRAQLDRLGPLPTLFDEPQTKPDEDTSENVRVRTSWRGKGSIYDPISLGSDEETSDEEDSAYDSGFQDCCGDDADDEGRIEADFHVEGENGINDIGDDLDEEIDKLMKWDQSSLDARSTPSLHSSIPSRPRPDSSKKSNQHGSSDTQKSASDAKGAESEPDSPPPSPAPQPRPDSSTPVKKNPHNSNNTQQPANNSPEPEPEPEFPWTSHMQLVLFRESANKIADEYVKNTLGIKITKGRRRSHKVRDRKAYKKGIEDGKKIDVHMKKAIAGEAFEEWDMEE